MNVIGYIRVSTDTQDLEKQRHLLLEYAQRHQLLIGEFINVEVSSRKDTKERRIDELLAKLDDGDTLIVAELSRLGRNMLETLNIINRLGESRIIFVRRPELSTLGSHTKLLLAIYCYFAEAARESISVRPDGVRPKPGPGRSTSFGQATGTAKGKLQWQGCPSLRRMRSMLSDEDILLAQYREYIRPITSLPRRNEKPGILSRHLNSRIEASPSANVAASARH